MYMMCMDLSLEISHEVTLRMGEATEKACRRVKKEVFWQYTLDAQLGAGCLSLKAFTQVQRSLRHHSLWR